MLCFVLYPQGSGNGVGQNPDEAGDPEREDADHSDELDGLEGLSSGEGGGIASVRVLQNRISLLYGRVVIVEERGKTNFVLVAFTPMSGHETTLKRPFRTCTHRQD